jgi:hypothetical protein
MDGEQFLGGFGSGFLARGIIAGYGVYATNLRLFGVRDPTTVSGGHLAGLVEGELMPKLSPEENLKVIEGLDAKKEFDVTKDQISRIELKRPGLLSGGHIAITPKNGGQFKVSIRHPIGFERLRDVMQVFDPEVLTLK